MFRIWKIKAESRLDALLARLKPSPLMARALPCRCWQACS
jgi:type IV secretion system protein VirB2